MATVNLGLGACKATLETGVEDLQRVLDEAQGLSNEDRSKDQKAIVLMKSAHIVLTVVDCDQPAMSYDIAGFAARKGAPAKRRNTRRKR